jgi:CheY-like chemotaxis protein/HPt (histidine-containing phosphotransfer) domain-containing protein
LHVLIAEDHPVNQQLVVRLLQKRGHTVVVAGDGQEALEALSRELFDVVLMDIQMPRMSGLEATAAIRERERAGGHRTSIVAMTAHAILGDRERCLDAGMDDYLSKPLSAAVLYETIERQLVTPVSADPLSDAALLDRLDGDRDLLSELAELFLEDCPARKAALAAAVRGRDGHALEAVAHLFRGSVSIFGAEAARAAALSLETMGHEDTWDGVEETAAVLTGEVERLESALRKLSRSRGELR